VVSENNEYAATLKGVAVVIVADKDTPGREHATEVAAKLQGVAASVKVIELPDRNGKPVKDAADFFTAGGTAADFKARCEQAAQWTPPALPPQADTLIARGLELCDNGTDGVLFAAGKTLKPWNVAAMPADLFETCRLFRDARTAAKHGKDLLRAWVYSLPTSPRCKPPLCLAGEIGSGKTRLAAGIAELFGVPFNAQKVEESSEADFWPALDNGGAVCFDNADSRTRWLAEALACAATGGSQQRRRLYTNTPLPDLRTPKTALAQDLLETIGGDHEEARLP
jgi:hypothetical protein